MKATREEFKQSVNEVLWEMWSEQIFGFKVAYMIDAILDDVVDELLIQNEVAYSYADIDIATQKVLMRRLGIKEGRE